MDAAREKATICVVNYRTAELTKLCLRSIRRFTQYPYEMVVVDNDSQDESTEYLRSLGWIKLIERTDKTNDLSGGYAHVAALDMALAQCRTEYFVSLHSDTLIHRAGWLDELVKYFSTCKDMACVGGGKVELSSVWRGVIKKMTDIRTLGRRFLKTPDPGEKHRYYNRTVCSVYKTEILKKENLTFLMDRDKGYAVGKKLYFELVDRGYPTVELSDAVMKKYLYHLAHATQVVNSKRYNLSGRTVRRTNRLIKEIMESELVKDIINDNSPDN